MALLQYFEERLALKLKHMKLVLAKQLHIRKDFAYRRINSMFSRAQKQKKNDFNERIKTLISYNVLDNPMYLDAKKIRKRIVRFTKARASTRIS